MSAQPRNTTGSTTKRETDRKGPKEGMETFTAFAANANDGIIILAAGKGSCVYVNRKMAKMTGYGVAEVLTLSIKDLVHPDEFEKVMGRYRNRLAGKRVPKTYETVVVRKDGTSFPVELTAGKMIWQGQPADMVIVRDITRRKQTEEERDRLFNLSLDMLCIAGFDGYFKELNPAWEKAVGWTNDELVSKPYLEFVHPDDREPTIEAAQGLTEGKAAVTFENRYLCKDGSYRWISWNSFPLVEEELIFAVARDVTDIKRVQAELEASNRELEAFSYSVSHDLRAPLRSIDGFSQALLEDCFDKLDPQGKDYLQRVRAASQRMARLIDDVLKLSRITRSEMRRDAVDLSAMANEIVAELKRTEPKRNVEVVVAPRLRTHGDAALLRVALENLLGNAWKFTGTRRRARIEFGAVHRDGKTSYFVRDNGVGFDQAYAGKLFTPFQRLHASDQFSGTGIGLATVQRAVARHGGRVWAEGAVDKGATFYFTIR